MCYIEGMSTVVRKGGSMWQDGGEDSDDDCYHNNERGK